jgi:UDP-2-acetamido-3-amino-2,3-dideoxy-glucuronate N-acetyltransferase
MVTAPLIYSEQLLKNASIGANSAILPSLTICEGAVIGAGSIVTKSVNSFSLVFGNPSIDRT